MKLFGLVTMSLFCAVLVMLVFTMWLEVEPGGGVLALALLLGCVLALALRAFARLFGGRGDAGKDAAKGGTPK